MDKSEYINESRDNYMCTNTCNTSCLNLLDPAPYFQAESTFGKVKLTDYAGKWLILFSHPHAFTPVCSTEFIAFANLYPEFRKRNCCLLGLSIDSNASHLEWVNDLKKVSQVEIPFPIIADTDMKIAKAYNMISPNASNTSTVRNVYVICPEQKIQCILSYPMNIGRNIVEILRILDALQISRKENVLTPANWVPGLQTLLPPPKTQCEMFNRINNPNDLISCSLPYLCYTQNKKLNMTK